MWDFISNKLYFHALVLRYFILIFQLFVYINYFVNIKFIKFFYFLCYLNCACHLLTQDVRNFFHLPIAIYCEKI